MPYNYPERTKRKDLLQNLLKTCCRMYLFRCGLDHQKFIVMQKRGKVNEAPVGFYDAAIRSTLLLWALDSLSAKKSSWLL
jgi:hypothetical protein